MYKQYESEYEAFKPEKFEYNFESETEMYGETESPFSEAEEMELAMELLEISNEAELEQFLGSLVSKAWRGIKSVGAKALPAVGGILKSVAKKALPIVGGALGSFIPIPGVGTMVGTALGNAASNLFEGELEGLSQEEAELEVARRFVRFGGATARGAASLRRAGSPYWAARRASRAASRHYLPGLYRQRWRSSNAGQPVARRYAPGYQYGPPSVRSRWVQRGYSGAAPGYYAPPVVRTAWVEPAAEPTVWQEPGIEPQGPEGDEGAE
jgi:uncharacterized protein (DUF697 family)